jgi:hypothetical protein
LFRGSSFSTIGPIQSLFLRSANFVPFAPRVLVSLSLPTINPTVTCSDQEKRVSLLRVQPTHPWWSCSSYVIHVATDYHTRRIRFVGRDFVTSLTLGPNIPSSAQLSQRFDKFSPQMTIKVAEKEAEENSKSCNRYLNAHV